MHYTIHSNDENRAKRINQVGLRVAKKSLDCVEDKGFSQTR